MQRLIHPDRPQRQRPDIRAFLFWCAWAAIAGISCGPGPAPVTIRAGLLLDGRGGEMRDALITVVDQRIRSVAPYQGSPVTHDLSGYTVLPGLIDAHVHISGYIDQQGRLSGGVGDSPARRSAALAGNALATLRAGFTTVMSMGSDADKELRDAIDAGSIPGPRILTSMSPVHDTGLSASQARRLLRRLKASGADFVKIFATNSVMEGGDPLYTRERLAILCRQARRYGLPSVIHAQSDSSLRVASAAGCDRVEHGILATTEGLGVVARSGLEFGPQCGLVLDNYLDHRAGLEGMKGFAPEVMSYMERLRPALPNVIRTALTIPGLTILYGTDATAGAHGKNAEDLVCRVREAGESPLSALISATSRNAESLGLGKEVGTIAPGFEADIIALEGNPLEEIESVRRVRFVMKGGRVFMRPGAKP